jgi:hypothetical protein
MNRFVIYLTTLTFIFPGRFSDRLGARNRPSSIRFASLMAGRVEHNVNFCMLRDAVSEIVYTRLKALEAKFCGGQINCLLALVLLIGRSIISEPSRRNHHFNS